MADLLLSLLPLADVAEAQHVANLPAIHAQRSRNQGNIQQLPGLVHPHRLSRQTPFDVHLFFKHRHFMPPRLRHNQLRQAFPARFFSGKPKHLGKRRVGVEHMAPMHNHHRLRNARQHVFHQPRLRGSFSPARMRHNHALT